MARDTGPSTIQKAYQRETREVSRESELSPSFSCGERLLYILSLLGIIITFPITLFFCVKVVHEYERAVIFRFGKILGKCHMPGLVFIVPCTDVCCIIDLRTVSYDVPSQEVLTRDAVTVQVDAVIYYKVVHPMLAVVRVFNFTRSTHFMAATALRNVIGTHNLAELLQERSIIAKGIEHQLDIATYPWGVKVERVEIKDVSLPELLQTTMAAEAGASREARAKVIAADGEFRAAKALRQASSILADSPAALQLRYLQTLSTIGTHRNSTVIFPLPMDMITPFLHQSVPPCASDMPCMTSMDIISDPASSLEAQISQPFTVINS